MPSFAQSHIARVLLIIALLACCFVPALRADDISYERGNCKAMLKAVAAELEKNFYDPKLKGLDWRTLVDQARDKIDNAKSVSEMMTTIYILVDKIQDSHTKFLPPSRNVRYKFGFDAKPIGEDIYVCEIRKKGAAEKAGLQLGDRILSVNGFNVNRKNYDNMMFAFKVLRNLGAFDVVLQRENEEPKKIHLEAEKKVESTLVDLAHDDSDIWELIHEDSSEQKDWHTATFKDGIGYAQLLEFTWEGEDLLRGLIEKSGAKSALILDLRDNGGGYEDTLKNDAGFFTQTQIVMGKVNTRKKTEELVIKPRRPYYSMPLYVLVDSETGSAAEMLARHLQLTRGATIVGDHSSGRVTRSIFFSEELGTERVVPFGVQIGVGQIVFPDGKELEGNGVSPDERCLPSARDLREERDVCLWKTVEIARKQLKLGEDLSIPTVKKAVGIRQ